MSNDDTALLTINGGTLNVNAGGDGLDSNGNLVINGGETYISGPVDNGNSAIDYGDGATATINGGTLVALGSSGMVESFSDASTQGMITISASGAAGDEVSIVDSSANVLASYTAQKQFNCVQISTAGLSVGESYTVAVAGIQSEVTLDSVIYSEVSGGMRGADSPGSVGFAPQKGNQMDVSNKNQLPNR